MSWSKAATRKRKRRTEGGSEEAGGGAHAATSPEDELLSFVLQKVDKEHGAVVQALTSAMERLQ